MIPLYLPIPFKWLNKMHPTISQTCCFKIMFLPKFLVQPLSSGFGLLDVSRPGSAVERAFNISVYNPQSNLPESLMMIC